MLNLEFANNLVVFVCFIGHAHMALESSAIRMAEVQVPPAVGQRGLVHSGLALSSQPGGQDTPCYTRLPTVFYAYRLPLSFVSDYSSSSVVVVVSGATQ
jgi:hypothetical protein